MNFSRLRRSVIALTFAYLRFSIAYGADTPPKAPVCEDCKSDAVTLSSFTESKWKRPELRKVLLDANLNFTAQDGNNVIAKELLGRPVALTFLYTRCDNPKKCPLVADTISKLQKILKSMNIQDAVQIAVMTYDPEYDTAQVLKDFAAKNSIVCDENTMMLRPNSAQKKAIFDSLEVTVNYNEQRVNIHGIQLLLLDSFGRLAKSYHTLIWDNKKVVSDLERLIAEEKDKKD